MKKKPIKSEETDNQNDNFPGYPMYPPSEDIFSKNVEIDLNVGANEGVVPKNLDVPGSELDDDAEKIGSEDEENNYYSIGGDNHDDLSENQGA